MSLINHTSPVYGNQDGEGRIVGEEVHCLECQCAPCVEEEARWQADFEASRPEPWVCPGQDCPGCQSCPDVPTGKTPAQLNTEWEAWGNELNPFGVPGLRNNGLMELGAVGYSDTIAHISGGRTAKGLEYAFLCLGIEVRYNVRAQLVEYRDSREGLAVDTKWRELTDRVAAEMREFLAERFTTKGSNSDAVPMRFGLQRWADALNSMLYHREIDPFKEWLESLPAWDGKPRLQEVLFEVFHVSAESIPLARWAGQYIFLGSVWRTFQPGVKQDETPVLIGKGGIGKSSTLRYLLPAQFRDMFSDTLRFTSDEKTRVEALQGRVIVEAAEMTGATRAEIDSIKAFLSRTDDGAIRLAYRRNPERMPRRCIVVGTADNDRPLPNDHNLRRFVPVNLNGGDPVAMRQYLDANRVQLWAEAVTLYRQGVDAYLPPGLKRLQQDATDNARSKNMGLEDAIDEYLESRGDAPFQSAAMYAAIGLVDEYGKAAKVDRTLERAAAAYLGLCGWKRGNQRIDGVQAKCWYLERL